MYPNRRGRSGELPSVRLRRAQHAPSGQMHHRRQPAHRPRDMVQGRAGNHQLRYQGLKFFGAFF